MGSDGNQPVLAPVERLGFVEVVTEDVDRLADYYEHSLGLANRSSPDGRVFLSAGTEHHCVVLSSGPANGRARVGLQLSGSLPDAQARLRAAGIAAERLTDPEPGISDALALAEPATGTPLTLYEAQTHDTTPAGPPWRPGNLGHIAGYVTDLASIREFYETAFGFRWADAVGQFFIFMRCNTDHHAVNFLQSDRRSGLFHIAFEMNDFDHLKRAMDGLAGRGIRMMWGPGRHGPGHNVFTYHRDADDNIVELFCDIDRVADEETGEYEPRPWHAYSPMLPHVWEPTDEAANMWGPLLPGFIDR